MLPPPSTEAKSRPPRSWAPERAVLDLQDLVQNSEESLELICDDFGTLTLTQGEAVEAEAAVHPS